MISIWERECSRWRDRKEWGDRIRYGFQWRACQDVVGILCHWRWRLWGLFKSVGSVFKRAWGVWTLESYCFGLVLSLICFPKCWLFCKFSQGYNFIGICVRWLRSLTLGPSGLGQANQHATKVLEMTINREGNEVRKEKKVDCFSC